MWTPALIDSIKRMVVVGNRMDLPKTALPNYLELKRVLIAAGGKYKKNGFDFTTDAQAIKDRLIGGEKINDKKKYQQFFTPHALAVQLHEMAEVEDHHTILEPSAGQAAIANVVYDAGGGSNCVIVELDPVNIAWLRTDGWDPIEGDFLKLHKEDIGAFDRIIANPPFTKNQDVDHILHMYKFLEPGGVLVSLSSTSWRQGTQKKQVAFREWLQSVDAEITEVPTGAFKESGTNVATVIIKVTKPGV